MSLKSNLNQTYCYFLEFSDYQVFDSKMTANDFVIEWSVFIAIIVKV